MAKFSHTENPQIGKSITTMPDWYYVQLSRGAQPIACRVQRRPADGRFDVTPFPNMADNLTRTYSSANLARVIGRPVHFEITVFN